jgi:hypothetical protein
MTMTNYSTRCNAASNGMAAGDNQTEEGAQVAQEAFNKEIF